jgi:hypothetical protein
MTSSSTTPARKCRFCGSDLSETFCDLGTSPLSNAFLKASDLSRAEKYYPLHVFVCSTCFLVQLEEFESPQAIFSDYAYFSSYSESWLAHAREYVAHATERFALAPNSLVMEVASNDGYLLQYFHERGIPVLGVEPAENVARVAQAKGVRTISKFFGITLAEELVRDGMRADLIVGNNVLAHVPDINDFVAGLRIALAAEGSITMEFPHLVRLMKDVQFDTIYHEHFSYLSLLAVEQVFGAHGLSVFDVRELPTHGGSLRVYATHTSRNVAASDAVQAIRSTEDALGLSTLATYRDFGPKVHACKRSLLRFLIDAAEAGKTVAGYGAPAKGNTLLTYCGVRSDLLPYTVDRSPHKQGLFLPGTRIPIHSPDKLVETRPDYVLILPWNLRDEIIGQLIHVREWGGRFVTPVPSIKIWD